MKQGMALANLSKLRGLYANDVIEKHHLETYPG
jgi:hypothetical protein